MSQEILIDQNLNGNDVKNISQDGDLATFIQNQVLLEGG